MTFEQQHGDVIQLLPTVRSYKAYSVTGLIVEAYEKDDDGVWHDVTLREQEIQRAERELKRAKRILAKEEQDDTTNSESN